MTPRPAPSPTAARRSPAPVALRVRAGLATVLVAVLATGCSVRLETPSPSEPEPDSREVARRAAVTDALDVAELARELLVDTGTEEPPGPELARTVDAAAVHLEALGGVYDSGLVDPDGGEEVEVAPTATTTSTASPDAPEPAPSATEVAGDRTAVEIATLVDRLSQGYSRARGSLVTVPEAGLARLVASIGTAQLAQARTIAAAAGVPITPVDLPATPSVPAELPGIPAGTLVPLVELEDAAGYAFEVVAARVGSEAERVAASARADVHRDRAQAWAIVSGVAGTSSDPRAAVYALPPDVLSGERATAHLGALETDLADAYGTLLGEVAEDDRIAAADLLTDSYLSARTWGAAPLSFPGMPEQRD
jgi:hypothetical protein